MIVPGNMTEVAGLIGTAMTVMQARKPGTSTARTSPPGHECRACRGLPMGGSTQRLVAVIIWSLQIDQPISQQNSIFPCRRPFKGPPPRVMEGWMSGLSRAWKRGVG